MKIIFMIILLLPVLILAQYNDNQTRKINLEDIEDDNLLSEKLAQENDPLITQSTQHLRPPSVLAINPYLVHSPSTDQQNIKSGGSGPGNIGGGIHYVHPESSEEEAEEEENDHHRHHHSNYVTKSPNNLLTSNQQFPSNHGYTNVAGAGAASHEHEPTYTYTTLANRHNNYNKQAILPTIAALSQQPPPQYVFVHQANHNHEPQAIQQVVGGIQYLTSQPPSPIIYGHGSGIDITENNVKTTEHDDQDIIYHHHHNDQQPPPQVTSGNGGAMYLQYVPYIARGPNDGQSYIMMAPIPAGYSQSFNVGAGAGPNKSEYPHVIGLTGQQTAAYYQPQSQYIHLNPNEPTTTAAATAGAGGIQYLTNNAIEDVAVQPHSLPISSSYQSYNPNSNIKPQYSNKFYASATSAAPTEEAEANLQSKSENSARNKENFLSSSYAPASGPGDKLYPEMQNLNNKIIQFNHNENFVPIKASAASPSQIQDIQYLPSTLATAKNMNTGPGTVQHQNEKSNQKFYAPEREQQQSLSASKSIHSTFSLSSNRFSSFPPSTTDSPAQQRQQQPAKQVQYYAAPSHPKYFSTTSATKSNQQQQQPRLKYWSANKVVPMQNQQNRKPQFNRYPTNTNVRPIISESYRSSTTIPVQAQTNQSPVTGTATAAFRSPIPKLHGPSLAKSKTLSSAALSNPTAASSFQSAIEQHHKKLFSHQPQQQQQQQQQQRPFSTITPIQQQQSSIKYQNNNNHHPIKINSDNFLNENRQPKSLLESYIPSWVIIQNQQKQQQQLQFQSQPQLQPQQNYPSKYFNHNYNTISYSVPHNLVINGGNYNNNLLKRSALLSPTTSTTTATTTTTTTVKPTKVK